MRQTKAVKVTVITDRKNSKVKAELKNEMDINNIIRKYNVQDLRNMSQANGGQYLDVTPFTDYSSALEKVLELEHAFMAMPAEQRKFFNHDPQQLVEFLQDEKNGEKALQLGLLAKPTTKMLQAREQALRDKAEQAKLEKAKSTLEK